MAVEKYPANWLRVLISANNPIPDDLLYHLVYLLHAAARPIPKSAQVLQAFRLRLQNFPGTAILNSFPPSLGPA